MTKAELHKLIDELPDTAVEGAAVLLRGIMAAGSWRALSQRTGISERAFNRWRRGECTTITIAKAQCLADALGHSPLAIWGLANSPAGDRAADPQFDLAVTGAERLFRSFSAGGSARKP